MWVLAKANAKSERETRALKAHPDGTENEYGNHSIHPLTHGWLAGLVLKAAAVFEDCVLAWKSYDV